MRYKVLSPVEHDLVRFEIGDRISFTADQTAECETLLDLHVIAPIESDADLDDLASLSVKALVEIAKAEDVSVPPKASKADLIGLIESKRIEGALAGEAASEAGSGAS